MFNAIVRVEAYKPPARPQQCQNCQQFTHSAAACLLNPVCSFCGREGHRRNDGGRLADPQAKPVCRNCGDNHSCRYAKCPVWQEARMELMANKAGYKATRPDARPRVHNPHGIPKEAFAGARYPGLPTRQQINYPSYAAATIATATAPQPQLESSTSTIGEVTAQPSGNQQNRPTIQHPAVTRPGNQPRRSPSNRQSTTTPAAPSFPRQQGNSTPAAVDPRQLIATPTSPSVPRQHIHSN